MPLTLLPAPRILKAIYTSVTAVVSIESNLKIIILTNNKIIENNNEPCNFTILYATIFEAVKKEEMKKMHAILILIQQQFTIAIHLVFIFSG